METQKLKEIQKEIDAISKATAHLLELSDGIQAIERNTRRIQASVKMLEINISDILSVFGTKN